MTHSPTIADRLAQQAQQLMDTETRTHPRAVLDRIMEPVRNTDIHFEAADGRDHLDAPSPLAELIRRAFAPRITADALARLAPDREEEHGEAEADHISRAWGEAVEAFGRRYELFRYSAEP